MDNNTGNWNTGDYNTGDWNTGDWNTGNWNTGCRNTGGRNTGDSNTGDGNTGYWNTGCRNTGDRNTGYWNTGCRNTGDRNTGDSNTGDWNTGNYNTGYCNTITPDECLIFNKKGSRKEWNNADKPSWMYVNLTEWVREDCMSIEEKEANPSYKTTEGYLKYYSSLKEAYAESWKKTSEEDRAKTFNLPNFDIKVFEEIFGFKPKKEEKKTVKLELTDEQLEKIKTIIGD